MNWRSVTFPIVLFVAGCGASPTTPASAIEPANPVSATEPTSSTSAVEPFPPFDQTPIEPIAPVPNYAGDWKGTGTLTGCDGPSPTCTRASQSAAFFPPSINLVLDQQAIRLSGTISVNSVQDTQVVGTITADGGFVVSGSQPVLDSQFYVTAKFTHVDDTRIDGSVITETRFGGRLAYTFRYSVGAVRQ